MADRLPLLIEIGTEELPPKALATLAEAFRDGLARGLDKAGLGHTGLRALYSPRRLALLADHVDLAQPDQPIERRGPARAAALDADGQPTRALLGFAQSCGVQVSELEQLETDKGAWFVHRSVQTGQSTATLLPALIEQALKTLPVPRPMRWGSRDIAFVRPAHWVLVLLGDQVVEGTVLGLGIDRFTQGHRFHHPKAVWIGRPEDYVESLRAAFVLVDPVERRERVAAQVHEAARGAGGEAHVHEALLEEVSALVEWPRAIACTFEQAFLRVPAEVLVTTMEQNQKFFAVRDAGGALTRHFIGVANIESKDPAAVRQGYERVIRPRFADAAFFFDQDMATPLAAHREALAQVVYQKDLGSIAAKCERVAKLAEAIAPVLDVDRALARQAAELSRCDLMTRMVGEFPELQGVMGRRYAEAQGLGTDLAHALDEFYQPRFAGDVVPLRPLSQVLGIADRADTLAGIFAVGMKPSGNKDPFALRRAALGLARILIEGRIDLDLPDLLAHAQAQLPHPGAEPVSALHDFVLERLRGYYAEQDIDSDVFEAVAAVSPASLLDFDQRLRAVQAFRARPERDSLAQANKRIRNILRKAEDDIPGKPDGQRIEHEAERMLLHALVGARVRVPKLCEARMYEQALAELAGFEQPLAAFFDGVMVMAEDGDLRRNRLALLKAAGDLFLEVADIGQLAG
jgi:glycyl-tRNA synthetase beta chain